MNITVRHYLPADAPFIAALEAECFHDPWSQKAIEEAHAFGTLFLVAESCGEVVGYAGVKPVLDEGYISNVAVTEKMRSKGVGSLIMEELTLLARKNGLKTVSLEVRPSNTAAISLYKKFGYKEVGRRRNFYSHPTEDGLILTQEVD